MAESLDDGEFWLPPQFLAEIFMEKKDAAVNNKNAEAKDVFGSVNEYGGTPLFPCEFPYGFGSFNGFSSDLGSPVESVVGSTETESDEEDYLAGLTRQMAHSTLEDEYRRNRVASGAENTKRRTASESPQSTLCAAGNACGCGQGSGHGSPNGPLRVSSSSATWDLLYAAAGEVAKLRGDQGSHCFNHNSQRRTHWDPPRMQPSAVSLPMENSLTSDASLYQNPLMSYQKLQESQYQQLRHHQMMKQQEKEQIANGAWIGQLLQNQTAVQNNRGRNTVTPLGLSSSTWPPLQPRKTGSDMRAVFAGNPRAKRESAGTGVFLPRRVVPPMETRKKPGCTTVLLPARVVQALNLNLDDRSGPQHRYPSRYGGSFNADGDAAFFRLRGDDNVPSHQKLNILRSQPVMMNNNEVRLPQEWTY